MDSLFSSSFSTFSSPQRPLFPPLSPFRVRSVPVKEKPRTMTTTTMMSRTREQTKKPTLSTMNEKHTRRSMAKNQSPTAKIFKAFDDIITNFIDPPLRDAINPKHVLSENFFPVDELPPTECVVSEGILPSCLDGVYLRNGPNPQFLPQGPYHLFDGDGMVHAIRISKGKVTLCSRYVKTSKYHMEKDAGFPIIPNVIAGFNGLTASMARMAVLSCRFLVGQFDQSKDLGLANTNLALFGNKLYALWESDLPYALKIAPDGDIITIGRHDFDGKLFTSMTAHPKIDPVTKEAFAFRYGPTRPFLTFFRFNENGEKQVDVPIFSMTSPSFLHDFSITKNYAIFSENQIRMSMMAMMGGGSLFTPDPKKIPRVGVIPRYAKDESEIKWFEVPGWNNIHSINAWEEDDGDTVVMLAPNMLLVEHTLERMNLIHASVEKMTINLKTGMVSRHPLSTRNLDYVVFNPAFVAVKNRYIYCGIGGPMPKISGIVKLDVSLSDIDRQECIVATRIFEPGCFGGEPFFVAKEPDNLDDVDEDDGYIISFVHNENTNESRFLVMDAKSPTLETIAVVEMPRRVPYGFHGLFVKESDLKKL